ncbi:MAG: aconitate hydratase, partial [Caloramator sp.]|nr:aconitate hydratase [Caloramator sp.]
ITMPKIVKVKLTGALKPYVSAKDIVLEILKRLTVKGGVGKILEYAGDGVKTLSVPERATIANMGAELGATTSIFPSDEQTYKFLKAQGREMDFINLKADEGAEYDEEIEVDLSSLEPLAACPHSPDNVKKISELGNVKVDQIAIGSCTNSSYTDIMKAVQILKGKTVAENVSLVISPGSRQVLNMISQNGGLSVLISSGARILECACGPCIGMGQSPATDAVSLRTFNRNFEGRSGTLSAKVYIVSPEVAAASAITGYITDPRNLDIEKNIKIEMPEEFIINDNMIIPPSENPNDVEIQRGPNIKPFPKALPLSDNLNGKVLIKLNDNITTDHIMPSNAKLLPYRSNIPYLSEYCLTPCDKFFPEKARKFNGGFIIAGENYGQGSSREHAALVPLYLGIKAVLAKSFARIHMANLINNGILPLIFNNPCDYDDIDELDDLFIESSISQVKNKTVIIKNKTKNKEYKMLLNITDRQAQILIYGGLLNYTK